MNSTDPFWRLALDCVDCLENAMDAWPAGLDGALAAAANLASAAERTGRTDIARDAAVLQGLMEHPRSGVWSGAEISEVASAIGRLMVDVGSEARRSPQLRSAAGESTPASDPVLQVVDGSVFALAATALGDLALEPMATTGLRNVARELRVLRQAVQSEPVSCALVDRVFGGCRRIGGGDVADEDAARIFLLLASQSLHRLELFRTRGDMAAVQLLTERLGVAEAALGARDSSTVAAHAPENAAAPNIDAFVYSPDAALRRVMRMRPVLESGTHPSLAPLIDELFDLTRIALGKPAGGAE